MHCQKSLATKRKILAILMLGLLPAPANAEMVLSTTLGFDPKLLKLCLSREDRGIRPGPKGALVPFLIDRDYVDRYRADTPNIVWFVRDDYSPQLIDCRLNETTGKYGPLSMQPEGQNWSLVKPSRYEPSFHSAEGEKAALDICTEKLHKAVPRLADGKSGSAYAIAVREVGYGGEKKAIGGKLPRRYDVVVQAQMTFEADEGPDAPAPYNYTCLLTPMFDVKGFSFRRK